MTVLNFTLSGDVVIQVTITELLNGTLQFDLAVTSETGSIGDLNGLFFDIADESLLGEMVATGDDVTGMIFEANDVTKVDNYNNIRGELLKDLGKFDGGVQFGTAGMAKDDIRETSFVLSHESAELTADLFLGMDFAARLTSVGPEGGARDGSSKIGGQAPTEPGDGGGTGEPGDGGGTGEPGDGGGTGEPGDGGGTGEPGDGGGTGDPGDGGGTGSVNIANDDSMTVRNTEGFSPFGLPDLLDDFTALGLLDNDTADGGAYTGPITQVAGQNFADGMIVAGSDGGLLMVFADGSVDFSANGEFDALGTGESAFTQFVYTIEGGDDAILTVEVFADDFGDGGGGDGGVGIIGTTDVDLGLT